MRGSAGVASLPLRSWFAGYRLDRLVGRGSTSEIYAASHPRLPRIDALKMLRPDVADLAPYRRRFFAEADIMSGLDHPAIVPVYDRGEAEFGDGVRIPWIAMKLIVGIDARSAVIENGPMTFDDAVATVHPIAGALDYLHDRGHVHRDVRPRNILVGSGPRRPVFLADFGVANAGSSSRGGRIQAAGVQGAAGFTAPEEFVCRRTVDGRSDQYSLAVTTFWLLTGRMPFRSASLAGIVAEQLGGSAPSAPELCAPELCAPELRDPELRSDVAENLSAVIAIALDPDPDRRFPSCSAFVRALRGG